jgi:nucleoside 2-deoxyribosyltransferase
MLESLTADSIIEEIWPVLNGTARPEKPVLYFGRAIRGGREELENSRKLATEADRHFYIISKHVLLDKQYDKDDVFDFEKKWKERFPHINVSQRDRKMIRIADCFAADVTEESTGVGGESSYARFLRKPSILFQHEKARSRPTMKLYAGRLVEPTLEDYLRLRNIKTPIYFYNNQNVQEVAREGFEKLSGCFLTTY